MQVPWRRYLILQFQVFSRNRFFCVRPVRYQLHVEGATGRRSAASSQVNTNGLIAQSANVLVVGLELKRSSLMRDILFYAAALLLLVYAVRHPTQN